MMIEYSYQSNSSDDDERAVSRAHKRRRAPNRDEVKEAENMMAPHPDIWFQDGNIVLLTGGTGFKVHKGVLERHSEVFRNMFEKPSPSDPKVKVGGCAAVHVSDTPEDVALLLSIMYGNGQK